MAYPRRSSADRSTDSGVSQAAEEFLRVSGHERWFLYVHLMDLHEYIYDEDSALFGSSYRDNYDNSMRWTDGTIRLWRMPTAARSLAGHTMPVSSVAVSSDGKLLVTASGDKSLRLWNAADGAAVPMAIG